MSTKTTPIKRYRPLTRKHIDYVNAHDGKLPPGMSVKEFIRRGAIELNVLPSTPVPPPRKNFKRLSKADMDYIDRNDGHLPHGMTIEQYEERAGVVGVRETPRHLRTEDWPGCPSPKMTLPGISCPRCGAHPLEVAGEFFHTAISTMDSKRVQEYMADPVCVKCDHRVGQMNYRVIIKPDSPPEVQLHLFMTDWDLMHRARDIKFAAAYEEGWQSCARHQEEEKKREGSDKK